MVVAFWESHRLAAIFVLCLAYGLAPAVLHRPHAEAGAAQRAPFQATLEELARNRELLP
ncbi:hypothetical protein ACE0DR_07935 [Azotobacter sp. CWF10]